MMMMEDKEWDENNKKTEIIVESFSLVNL